MTALNERRDAPCAVRTPPDPVQFEAWSLGVAVAAAARKVDERMLTRVGQAPAGMEARPLLALLTFCYARQVYRSIEVVAWLKSDEGLRSPSSQVIPDAQTIRRFRSMNRQALEFCLQAALRFQAEQKVSRGLLAKFSEKSVAEEARRRITMAMFIDSMELETEFERTNQVSLAC